MDSSWSGNDLCQKNISIPAMYKYVFSRFCSPKDMTAYQRALLKLGTIHTTSQNGMDCQTHVWCRPMEETLLTNVIC